MLVGLLVFLSGCENSYKETNFPTKPKDLEDCKFYMLSNVDGDYIRVVRCPNSQTSTTYREGKVTKTTVVIDGIEYIKKEQE